MSLRRQAKYVVVLFYKVLNYLVNIEKKTEFFRIYRDYYFKLILKINVNVNVSSCEPFSSEAPRSFVERLNVSPI